MDTGGWILLSDLWDGPPRRMTDRCLSCSDRDQTGQFGLCDACRDARRRRVRASLASDDGNDGNDRNDAPTGQASLDDWA